MVGPEWGRGCVVKFLHGKNVKRNCTKSSGKAFSQKREDETAWCENSQIVQIEV